MPYWCAFVGSLLLIGFGSYLVGQFDILNPFQLDKFIAVALGILLPCMLMFAIAGIYRRSQQMNYVSDALVQTALRLVRPEDVTTEGLSTVGQAVRREVSQLVGGVEHAVNRAGELEQLVHKELSALERVFGGNEERIHNLLQGLETQRGALEQAGFLIGNEANPILGRLEENTVGMQKIVSQASNTLGTLEHQLRASTDGLNVTMNQVAAQTAGATSEISAQAQRLEQVSEGVLHGLHNFSSNLNAQVDGLTNTVKTLEDRGGEVANEINRMTSSYTDHIRESAKDVIGAMCQTVVEM
ncbi:MAG: hypothetical protein AAF441_00860 [Pseudomonadota bacterium]